MTGPVYEFDRFRLDGEQERSVQMFWCIGRRASGAFLMSRSLALSVLVGLLSLAARGAPAAAPYRSHTLSSTVCLPL